MIRLTVDGGNPFDTLYVAFALTGTATEGDDYTVTDGMSPVAIETDGAGDGSFNVHLTALADEVADLDETVVLTVQSGTGYTATGSPAELTITDTPVVKMMPINGFEGGTASVVFTRTGDLSGTLTVDYTVSEAGTATSGTDFTALAGSVTFEEDEDTAVVTITLAHDTVYDPNESVVLLIEPTSTYVLDELALSATATAVIGDDARTTFDENGLSGTLWYDIPWDDIDPTQASQSLPVSNFTITVGDETFTEARSDISFITSPVANFAYGIFTGLTFAIDTSQVTGYQYTSVSMSGDTLSAVDPQLQDPVTALAPAEKPALILDFTPYDTNGTAHTLNVKFTLADNTSKSIAVPVAAAATGGVVRDSVYSVLARLVRFRCRAVSSMAG